MLSPMEQNATSTLRDLYPELSQQELVTAQDNLERYISLVLRIFERIEATAGPQADPLAPAVGTLDCESPRVSES